MKKILFSLVVLNIIIVSNMFSQPVISYTIPDIATPGMNVYTEIIAPYNATNNFGIDGLSLNNPSDNVHIELVNQSDTSKITFGPLVISWNGRCISTQVFVNPTVIANSSYWNNITSDFKIPFRVVVNGQHSNTDTIFIVNPYHLGDVSSLTSRTLGDGVLGLRSKRGAMIIDNVNFANDTYNVSISDCDPYTTGNQGYLPFILIAKNQITGSANTTISVNGGLLSGGPGGGGGGGRFCDAYFLNPNIIGDDGGNGFSGGGKGGRNYNDAYKNVGTGTGANGNSLNDNPPGTTPAHESSGGGTGHPFGASGWGCGDGKNCPNVGFYGAGSGRQQKEQGGSGGYSTDGTGSYSGALNGGKTHGNIMVVPIAGGSGGASGNPNGISACSGSGGGGGGAIALYGLLGINNVKLTADGGKGGESSSSSTDKGGAGSGGFVSFSSKLLIANSSSTNAYSVAGGNPGGGLGRARIDCPTYESLTLPTANSFYNGITTDTTQYVKRNFTLTGSANESSQSAIEIYIKPETGTWTYYGSVTATSNTWSKDITLVGYDTIYYLSAMQKVYNPISSDYLYEPSYVMSQASANILFLETKPIITGDSIINIEIIACTGNSATGKAKIKNIGDAVLILYFDLSTSEYGYPGFSLVSPTSRVYLNPGDSVEVTVRYNYQKGRKQNYNEIFWIDHNDKTSNHKPWELIVFINIDTLNLQTLDYKTQAVIDTLDIGQVCLGSTGSATFSVKNTSKIPINLDSPVLLNKTEFSAFIISDKYEIVKDTASVEVQCNPLKVGDVYTKMYLRAEECADYLDSIIIKCSCIVGSLTLTGKTNIGDIRLGTSSSVTLTLKNTGLGNEYISDLGFVSDLLSVTGSLPTVPITLKPNDSILIYIKLTPNNIGILTALYKVYSVAQANSCADSAEILITMNGVASEIVLSKYQMKYDTIPYCITKLDSITIYNKGTSKVNITSTTITGADKQYFTFVAPLVPSNYWLQPDSSETYYILFSPLITDIRSYFADLQIRTDDLTSDSLITVPLSGANSQVDVSYFPKEVDFGTFTLGQDQTDTITIFNNSQFDVTISKIATELPNTQIDYPDGKIIPANDSIKIAITLKSDYNTKGNITSKLSIIYNSPCPYIDTLDILGKGVSGNLVYIDTLNYGIIPSCTDSTMTIFWTNTGDAPIVFSEMLAIDGTDKDLFEYSDGLISPPSTTLSKGDTLFRTVIFNPSNSSDGIKTAFIIAKFIINNKDIEYKTVLIGEKRTGFLSTPSSVDFGSIISNSSKTMILVLKNTGIYNLKVIYSLLLSNPDVFDVEPKNLDSVLKISDSIVLNVVFKPIDQKLYTDTLYFYVKSGSSTCTELNKVIIRGTGLPTVQATIWMPDTTVSPKLDNFVLPVYGKLANPNDSLINVSFKMLIRFNTSMFYPMSCKSCSMTRWFDGETQTIEINVDSTNIYGYQSTLTELYGYTLLGDNDTTLLKLDSLLWKQSKLFDTTYLIDGVLRTLICKEGGKRLLKFNYSSLPLEMMVSPNPSQGNIIIDLQLLEAGTHSIEIMNVQGQSWKLIQWDAPLDSDKKYSFNFDINNFSSGVYYIVLKTPMQRKVSPLFIVK